MSEAEQYQKLRKYWKDKYRKAQRQQAISMWEAKYAIPHPSKVKHMQSLGYSGNMAVSSPANSVRNALRYQQEASDYANMLNLWKVEDSKDTLVSTINKAVPRIASGTVSPCEQLAVRDSVATGVEVFSLFGIFRIMKWDRKPTLPNILRISLGKYTFDIMRNKNDLSR